MDSDFAGDPVSRKSTTGLVAQIGNHTVKSGSTLQSLTALSVGEAEFYVVVKGGKVGLSLKSAYQDLGIPFKIEIQSDSSTSNFGYKNEFKMETSVSRKCLRRKTAQLLEQSKSLLQYRNNVASLQDWYSTDHGSHTPLQDDGDKNTETDSCQRRS